MTVVLCNERSSRDMTKILTLPVILDHSSRRKNSGVFISVMIGVSFNQPKLCPNATWSPNATTFANASSIGNAPLSIFVDINNTVYATARNLKLLQVWQAGSANPNRSISILWNDSTSLFVTANGDIYFDNGQINNRVDKWTMSTGAIEPVVNVTDSCRGLFIDLNNTLYCSIGTIHQVFQVSLNNSGNSSSVRAGSGVNGSAMTELNNPQGIFVDFGFNLYVADKFNNRIQCFTLGNLSGTTIDTGSIQLNNPTGVVLDGDGYLFIADRKNHRIIGSGPNGYRCVVGCSNSSSNTADKLNQPHAMSFDSYGNMFVTDVNNVRVQKFFLVTNSCGEPIRWPCATVLLSIMSSTSNRML